MSYEKIYIGKGTQVPNLQIAKVTCKLEDLLKIAYEIDGVKYVSFEVAKMKQPDKFGRDYTAYYNKKVKDSEPEKKERKPKKQTVTSDDLPF